LSGKITSARGHNVTFSVPDRELGKVDINFRVKRRGRLFGELFISKGALVWFPYWKKHGSKLSWSKFAELAVKYGRKGRGR
jgi:hypothetical protein